MEQDAFQVTRKYQKAGRKTVPQTLFGYHRAKKQWNGKEKLAIVLQGLKCDRSISELCNEHGITQGMYYKWRDQLLTDGAKLFDRGGVDHARERLEIENRRLKETIGELTVELKR